MKAYCSRHFFNESEVKYLKKAAKMSRLLGYPQENNARALASIQQPVACMFLGSKYAGPFILTIHTKFLR